MVLLKIISFLSFLYFVICNEIIFKVNKEKEILEDCVKDTGGDCIKDGYSYQINEKGNPLKAWRAFSMCTGCISCSKYIYLGTGDGNVKNIMKVCKSETCNSGSSINIGERFAIKTWCDNGCHNKEYLDRKSNGESSANTWSGSQWNKVWPGGEISVHGTSHTDTVWGKENHLYFTSGDGIKWEFRKMGITGC